MGANGIFSNENQARSQLRRLAARTCGVCVFGRMSKVEFTTQRAAELEATNRLKEAQLAQQKINQQYAQTFGAAALEIDGINVLHLGLEASPTPVPDPPEAQN